MLAHNFDTRGRSETRLKDLRSALAAARELGLPAPYSTFTAGLFEDLLRHDGDCDQISLLLEFERRAEPAGTS